MKTVSLRAFRDSLGKVDADAEPVEVVVRRDGYLINLGRWTPTTYALAHPFGADPVRPEHDRPRAILNAVVEGRPFTPAPKPGRKG